MGSVSEARTQHKGADQAVEPVWAGWSQRHTGNSSDRLHSKALDHDVGAKTKPKQRRFSFRKYFRDATSKKKKKKLSICPTWCERLAF